jgi:multicomponent Na+:H+ antiporter subunit C
MDLTLAILVGLLAACGTAAVLGGSLFRLLIGLVLLGQAANLLVFAAAGPGQGPAAIVAEGEAVLPPEAGDPLAQALVLTAIVIGFGVLAFCLALLSLSRRDETPKGEGGGVP